MPAVGQGTRETGKAGRGAGRKKESRELPGGGKRRAAGSKTERPERQNAPPGREMQEVRGAREARGGREAGDKKTAQGKASAPCRIQIYVRPALLPPDRKRRARKPPGVLARAVARRWGWPAPLPPDRKRRARKPSGVLARAVVRRWAAVGRYRLRRLRRYRRAAPRRLSKVSAPSPQRLSACGGSPVYSPAGACAVTAAPRRAVCRRSARPARRGSAAPARATAPGRSRRPFRVPAPVPPSPAA